MASGTAALQADPASIRRQAQEAHSRVENARVFFLDPDFIAILTLALLVDILDIPLKLLGILIVPEVIADFIDLFVAYPIIVLVWMRWRLGKLEDAKQNYRDHQERMQSMRDRKGRQIKGRAKSLKKNPWKRAFFKSLGMFIIELIPYAGLFFSWTYLVLSMLREKGAESGGNVAVPATVPAGSQQNWMQRRFAETFRRKEPSPEEQSSKREPAGSKQTPAGLAAVTGRFRGQPSTAQQQHSAASPGARGTTEQPAPEDLRFSALSRPESSSTNAQPLAAGQDITENYFIVEDGFLKTRAQVMPSMLTKDQSIIKNDCLCYVMERFPFAMEFPES